MKEIYEKPYMEVIIFEAEDVITASGGAIDTPFEPIYDIRSE